VNPSVPDLSIVTVSHGHAEQLRTALPTWMATASGRPRELVVVDNLAEEAVAGVVASLAPGATLLRNDRPRGFAANVNAGVARTRGRYVLLLNPDVRAEPEALERLVEFMEAHQDAGIAGPRLLNPDRTLQLSCRRFSTPFLFALRGLGLEKALERTAAQRRALMQDWDHAEVRDVDWVLGAAMIVRRRALEEVGPLDEGYFLYCEDQDWCHRMWTRGWRVYYVPDSIMIHDHRRASADSLFSRWKWVHARSKFRMFRKQGLSGRRPSAAPRR
jgi:N-acetylglucosaminyl-diphospho-decaprenol L-rhamnosyltransferase